MLKLESLIGKEQVFLGLESITKEDIIREMLGRIYEIDSAVAENKDALLEAILNRERLESTGIGVGVAIPHCHYPAFKFDVKMYVGFPAVPIDFGSLDGLGVRVVFMIISNAISNEKYLQSISRLMYLLKSSTIIEKLFTLSSADSFIELIREVDKNLDYISYKSLKQLMSLLELENRVDTYYQETILSEGSKNGKIQLKEDKHYIKLQKSLDDLISKMDNRLFSIYKQLKGKYKQDIFSKVSKNICSYCNVQLPIHILRELNRENMLIQCKVCAKILIR